MLYDMFVGEERKSTVEIWYQQKIEPVRMMKESKMNCHIDFNVKTVKHR